jgi:hypothetical protein
MSCSVIGYVDTVECEHLCESCGRARLEEVKGNEDREFLDDCGIVPLFDGVEFDEWEFCAVCSERLDVWPIEWAKRVALECREWAREYMLDNPDLDFEGAYADIPMIWLNLQGVMGIEYSDYWQGGHLGAIELSDALEEGQRALENLGALCVEECSEIW